MVPFRLPSQFRILVDSVSIVSQPLADVARKVVEPRHVELKQKPSDA